MTKVLRVVLVLALIVSVFAGCSKKEPITTATFIQIMEQEGYSITSDSEYGETLAVNANEDYMIVFMETDSLATAKSMLKTFIDAAEAEKDSVSSQSNASTDTYGTFSLTTDGILYRIVQIDQTITWTYAPAEFKDEISAVFKLLGY